MEISNISYIAGLLDIGGNITYKKYKEKRKRGNKINYYDCWRISMEISTTDYSILVWLMEILGCGTIRKKSRKGRKTQWCWRCTFRDAYYVSRVLWPYVHIKLGEIQQIIEHYAKDALVKDNVVNLEHYKMQKEQDEKS